MDFVKIDCAGTDVAYLDKHAILLPQHRCPAARCHLSNYRSLHGYQVAHLCPEHEREWFLRNSMAMWNTDLTLDPDNLLNGLSNVVLLRSDLHAAFDKHKFVFYPKSDDGFVVYMLEPRPDIGHL